MNTITDILKTMEYGPAPEEDSHVKSWLASHRSGFGHFTNSTIQNPSNT